MTREQRNLIEDISDALRELDDAHPGWRAKSRRGVWTMADVRQKVVDLATSLRNTRAAADAAAAAEQPARLGRSAQASGPGSGDSARV